MAEEQGRGSEIPQLPWERAGARTSENRTERVLEAFRAASGDNPDEVEAPEDEVVPGSETDEELENPEAGPADEEVDDEQSDDEEVVERDGEEPVYELDLGNEEVVEVTLNELADGYLRQSDYTRKTQEVAEIRKEASAERQEAREAREQYRARLEQVGELLEARTPKERTAEEWDALRSQDTEKYHREWTDHQRWLEDRKALKAEQERVAQEAQEEWEAEVAEVLAREKQALMDTYGWESEEQGNEYMAQLQSYATEAYGFTEEQLGSLVDHKAIVILDKARKWDELQAKQRKLQPKIKEASKATLKPGGRIRQKGSKPTKESQQRRARLRRTGKAADAVALVKKQIEEGRF